AKRAEQTAALIKQTAGIGGAIQFDQRIYEASPARLLEVISEQNEKIKSILLVGHNPGLEGLLKFLTGQPQPMPTAALAVVDLKTDKWSEANSSNGNLRILIRPKEVDK
ncbi:MAG: histidine phosphatase family protein, partial [Acidobacteriota bacterium]|nr:histidine phosphatase family protein [Acidobacteriota bacterium]